MPKPTRPKESPVSAPVVVPRAKTTHAPTTVAALLQRARTSNARALSPDEVQLLQRTVGNQVVQRLFAPTQPVLQRARGIGSDSDSEEEEVSEEEEPKERKTRKEASAEEEEEEGEADSESEQEVDSDVERLRRSFGRNRRRKSIPSEDRHLLLYQQHHNYHNLGKKTPIEIQDNAANFHLSGGVSKGTGGQPNFTTEASRYGGADVASDYDSLTTTLAGVTGLTQAQIAKMALAFINDGTPLNQVTLGAEGFRALSILIQLTQLIEPHTTRLPGTDKWARAALDRISRRRSTFSAEFNRTTGNFLPARAAKDNTTNTTLSGHGGQQWGRAAMGIATKNDPTLSTDEVFTRPVLTTLGYLSDSSSEDSDSEDYAPLPVNTNIVRTTTPRAPRAKVDPDGDWSAASERKGQKRRRPQTGRAKKRARTNAGTAKHKPNAGSKKKK